MDEILNSLIVNVRELMGKRELKECEKLIRQAMADYPDNAIPHNLMGLLYEKKRRSSWRNETFQGGMGTGSFLSSCTDESGLFRNGLFQ